MSDSVDTARFEGAGVKVEAYRSGMGFKDAYQKLLGLLGDSGGIMLRNDKDGEAARLSKPSIGKMMSNAAVRKSVENGFTREQHYAAISNIDGLFKASFKILSHLDKHRDPGVTIHRFASPLRSGDGIAYITVKDSVIHGKRLYSAELMKIKKLGGMLEDVKNSSHCPPSPSFYINNISDLTAAVNTQSKKFKISNLISIFQRR